jgi:hypothetical protein
MSVVENNNRDHDGDPKENNRENNGKRPEKPGARVPSDVLYGVAQ